MPNTYTLIASNTVSTAVSSITFSSIPATYTDLLLKLSVRTDRAGAVDDDVYIKLNGATTNFTYRYLRGNGTSANSSSGSVGWVAAVPCANATASTFGNAEVYIPNYASSNYKSISSDNVTENNATESYALFHAVLWSDTAAITSVGFTSGTSSNFVQYSTFYLYGIKNS